MIIRPVNITELIRHHLAKSINPWNFNYKLLIAPIFHLLRTNPHRALFHYKHLLTYHTIGFMRDYIAHLIKTGLEVHRRLWLYKRMVRRWRLRVSARKLRPINDTDLLFTPLSPVSISIMDRSSHFRFTCDDILGIFKTALLSNHNMIPTPCQPCNPYNRKPFTAENCMRIYVWMREYRVKLPFEMVLYEQSAFNLDRYKRDWNNWLTKNAIRLHIYNHATKDEIVIYMLDILIQFPAYIKLAIPELNRMSRSDIVDRFGRIIVDDLLVSNGIISKKEIGSNRPLYIWFSEVLKNNRGQPRPTVSLGHPNRKRP